MWPHKHHGCWLPSVMEISPTLKWTRNLPCSDPTLYPVHLHQNNFVSMYGCITCGGTFMAQSLQCDLENYAWSGWIWIIFHSISLTSQISWQCLAILRGLRNFFGGKFWFQQVHQSIPGTSKPLGSLRLCFRIRACFWKVRMGHIKKAKDDEIIGKITGKCGKNINICTIWSTQIPNSGTNSSKLQLDIHKRSTDSRRNSQGHFIRAYIYHELISNSLKLTNCPWKWMPKKNYFPFGARPYFHVLMLVSGRGNYFRNQTEPSYPTLPSPQQQGVRLTPGL